MGFQPVFERLVALCGFAMSENGKRYRRFCEGQSGSV
jgi:hypothetical protein